MVPVGILMDVTFEMKIVLLIIVRGESGWLTSIWILNEEKD